MQSGKWKIILIVAFCIPHFCALAPLLVRAQESLPAVGPPHSLIVPPDCKAKLEYDRIPAAELPFSSLSDCVYDFLAFIDKAELITVRGQDGFKKRPISFFDAHKARYAAALEKQIAKIWPKDDEFSQSHRANAQKKAMYRETALVRDYIERTRDRRRYYVDGVTVMFQLDGEYNFDSKTWPIKARVICDQQPEVFYGLCDLKISDIPLTFTLTIDPADAEMISRQRGEQRMELDQRFWLAPYLQGVYDPSWLFRETRYVAAARLVPAASADTGPAFVKEVALKVKKWYFLSHDNAALFYP